MRKLFLKAAVVSSILFVASLSSVSSAEKPAEGVGQWLAEVGGSISYVAANLKRQEDMTTFPLALRLGFDLKPCAEKFGIKTKGLLELLYESFVGYVSAPESNVEIGVPVSLKYGFPLMEKLYPYVQVGIGPYYTTQHTREQSTQFNFISQGGGGFIYFFKEHWALSADYRRRHVSNAGIKKPNAGIDANMYALGLSYYF